MRCCSISAIAHGRLEIRAVLVMFDRLRDVDAIENEVTLTEEGVEEIICHARVVRKVHILSDPDINLPLPCSLITKSMYV